jgi:hypothetical protein
MRDTFEDELQSAYEVNARAERYQQYLERKNRVTQLTTEAMNLDAALEKTRGELAEHMRSIPVPIIEMEVRDDGVFIAGIPFSSLSASERIKISTEIGIALNRGIDIMLIYDGSLLDADSFDWIINKARERGCQLWIETVGDGRTGDALVIEGGKIRVKDGEF